MKHVCSSTVSFSLSKSLSITHKNNISPFQNSHTNEQYQQSGTNGKKITIKSHTGEERYKSTKRKGKKIQTHTITVRTA